MAMASQESPAASVAMLERVVGIDPGLNVTGYAVVEPSPRGAFVVEAGVIRPGARLQDDGPAAGLDPPRDRRGARRVPAGRGRTGAGA